GQQIGRGLDFDRLLHGGEIFVVQEHRCCLVNECRMQNSECRIGCASNSAFCILNSAFVPGAKGGTRTPTASRPLDPKSSASANSATFALTKKGPMPGPQKGWCPHQDSNLEPTD